MLSRLISKDLRLTYITIRAQPWLYNTMTKENRSRIQVPNDPKSTGAAPATLSNRQKAILPLPPPTKHAKNPLKIYHNTLIYLPTPPTNKRRPPSPLLQIKPASIPTSSKNKTAKHTYTIPLIQPHHTLQHPACVFCVC